MYTKQDAKMTQGLAIVCMVVLHLFCRQGRDVLGQPLIWLNETTPFVYWFGFLRKSVYRSMLYVWVMRKGCCWKTEKAALSLA